MSILNVENVNSATYFVAQTTLRNVLGTKKLSELLTDRDAIGDEMQVKNTTCIINRKGVICIFSFFTANFG